MLTISRLFTLRNSLVIYREAIIASTIGVLDNVSDNGLSILREKRGI